MILLSQELATVLENVAVHEARGTHARAENPMTKTLERYGLIELKQRAPDHPLWIAEPYLGWGLTVEGRSVLGRGYN